MSDSQKQMARSKAGNLDTYDNGVIKFGDTDEKWWHYDTIYSFTQCNFETNFKKNEISLDKR